MIQNPPRTLHEGNVDYTQKKNSIMHSLYTADCAQTNYVWLATYKSQFGPQRGH